MARIFLTGASGYIGGDVLHLLKKTHPEYECSVLLRDSGKAAAISKVFPDVRIVLGDLDAASLIEEEASKADVIINAASNKNMTCVEAIARGLSKRDDPKPGHWIQVSGASVISVPDILNGTFGEAAGKVYGDMDNAEEVREIIRKNSGMRVVDNYLLNNVKGPKTALIFPPIIYGEGRGVIKQRSVQIPELSRVAIETRQVVQVGKGESTWSNIHISDLSDLFVKLVEKAVQGTEGDLWNQNGLYFVGNGMMSFGKISQLVADATHRLGLTDSTAVKSLSVDEADKLWAPARVFWGTNARMEGQRASRFLGWSPKQHPVEQEIPTTVKVEATRLGKL
ncbi:hypothetical protein N7532_000396 [Penicillium argentinense]|uniref:NAD-dependent epimerase/dehydratase domain-containing protein n=1 Tax=Penicillium argentinense TaxID=1131581 RepID=A0A9W9KNU0_9EURO|nr:uncharacterized protein N7532_000396 [Penicillium argentinense]KAJ5112351.1 hypothetical protein N7532_000396 [Penicillium argentinense]